MLGVLGAILGIFGLMLGHVRAYWGDLGKSSVETVANGGKWWQVETGSAEWAGAAGEGIRGGAVEIFYLTLWFSTPCTPIGGGGFNRYAHSAEPTQKFC